MKLKIIYDGDPTNTKVVNKETGEIVEGIVHVLVEMDIQHVLATLTFIDLEMELDDVEAVRKYETTEGVYGGGVSSNSEQNIH